MRGTTRARRVASVLGGGDVGRVGSRFDEGSVRFAAAAVVSLTGAVLAVPNAAGLVTATDVAGFALAALGTAVCAGLAAAGVLLYRSDFTGGNLVRVAGWTLLGLVVLGSVVGLHVVATGLSVAPGAGAFLIGNLLAVGAAAHVIIGIYDVQRVRADRLADERRKLAVLARVLRHNLRNDVTVVDGHAARARELLASGEATPSTTDGGVDTERDPRVSLPDGAVGPAPAAVADAVDSLDAIAARAERLGGYADATGRILRASDNPVSAGDTVDLGPVVEETVAAARGRFPEATLTAAVPASAPVRGDARVARAVAELVENACEHAGDRPVVDVTVEVGDRIPPSERATVFEDAEITQTTHGTGLGLWTVRAAVDSCGGRVEADGSSVRVVLPTA